MKSLFFKDNGVQAEELSLFSEALAFLANNAKLHKKSRTMNSILQDEFEMPWFSARGISKKFDKTFGTFVNDIPSMQTAFYDHFIENPNLFEGINTENDVVNTLGYIASKIKTDNAHYIAVNSEVRDILGYSDDPDERVRGDNTDNTDAQPEPSPAPEPTPQPEPKSEPKTEPKKDMKVKTSDKGFEGMFQLNIPILDMLSEAVDKNADLITKNIEEKINEAVKQLQPNVITINSVKTGEVKGKVHKQFERSLRKLKTLGNLFISGATGSGKTHLAKQLLEALGLDFGFMSLTAGISEAHLLGRMLMDGSYVSTQFVNLFENGGVFLMDEVDSADANTLLTLNSALANGELSVPNRKENPIAKKHKDFYIICSANTWGNGGMDYSGREVLDKAFMNRFSMSKIHVDYDLDLEIEITKGSSLTKKLQKARTHLVGTQRAISTRTIIDAHKCSLSGDSDKEIFEDLTVDFSEAERNKVAQALGI